MLRNFKRVLLFEAIDEKLFHEENIHLLEVLVRDKLLFPQVGKESQHRRSMVASVLFESGHISDQKQVVSFRIRNELLQRSGLKVPQDDELRRGFL